MKEFLKSVNICQNMHKSLLACFYRSRCTVHLINLLMQIISNQVFEGWFIKLSHVTLCRQLVYKITLADFLLKLL